MTNARKVQQNVEDAIESLQTSLVVLESANKVNNLLENKNYYAALKVNIDIFYNAKREEKKKKTIKTDKKTLDGLENDRLGQITEFTFAKMLGRGIPVMQNSIKGTVTVELKEWLARVREISREIGNLAMQRMQERQDRWRSKTTENPKLKNLQHHQVNSAIEMVVNEGLESMFFLRQNYFFYA